DLAAAVLGALGLAQPEERGMADAPVLRPLRETHLADGPRLDPVVAAPRRRADLEGRGGAPERLELRLDVRERRVVEARADLRDVHQPPALVEAQVERAEVGARALRRGVAADDELLAELALDLQPVPRAARGVVAQAPLRHDALEPLLGSRLVELPAVLEHVIAAAHDGARRR